MIDTIAFDADDTLWHNETLFTLTQGHFADLLAPYHDRPWIEQKLYETEVRNLGHFGYGVKGFALSMIETAVELTEGRIDGATIGRLIALAKEMLAAPVEVLPHVAETIAALADRGFRLMVVTKGDLFDQEAKVARSGLADCFHHVEVVSQKDDATYRRLCRRQAIEPTRLVMAGNSMKSDILPILAIGGFAAYVPYHTTWAHEAVEGENPAGPRFAELAHVGELVPQVEAWQAMVPGRELVR
jgi:putative hydrolase of the HAD superfamily